MWIKILEVLAVVLLALTLLTFVVGWVRHFPWWARLSAVVPLAASIGIASAIPGLIIPMFTGTQYVTGVAAMPVRPKASRSLSTLLVSPLIWPLCWGGSASLGQDSG